MLNYLTNSCGVLGICLTVSTNVWALGSYTRDDRRNILLLLLDYFELLMAYDYTTGYIMDEILQELYSQIRVVLPDFVFKAI